MSLNQRLHEQSKETPEGTIADPSMLIAYGKAATPTLNISWTSFLAWLKTKLNLVPKGLIMMWSGTVPPPGWGLCNGDDDKPDLRGRFVVGFGSDYATVGAVGGERTHALIISEIPTHNHTVNQSITSLAKSMQLDNPFSGLGTFNSSETVDTTTTGLGVAHENRPPYYVLAYIIKL